MHQTYELYFQIGDEPPRFEAATCPTEATLMSILRRRLDEYAAQSVEVRQFGEHLFTLTA